MGGISKNKDGVPIPVEQPFIHHFPDGNATIARMLVKKMIPDVGPGETCRRNRAIQVQVC